MDRGVCDSLLLLRFSLLVCASISIPGCTRLPSQTNVFSTPMRSGDVLKVYRLGYYDTCFLGLEVLSQSKPPCYYWIAHSPDVDFYNLSLRAEVSEQRDKLFISGTSTTVKDIYAVYDDGSGKFYTLSGVARAPSSSPSMESMTFEPASFPSKTGKTSIVFDGHVNE